MENLKEKLLLKLTEVFPYFHVTMDNDNVIFSSDDGDPIHWNYTGFLNLIKSTSEKSGREEADTFLRIMELVLFNYDAEMEINKISTLETEIRKISALKNNVIHGFFLKNSLFLELS